MKFTDLLFQNENFVRQKKLCYGMHKGYYVTAEMRDTEVFGTVQFKELEDTARQGLVNLLANLMQTHKKTDLAAYAHSVVIHIRVSTSWKKPAMIMESCMDSIIDYLISVGVGTGCAHCGQNEPLQLNSYGNLSQLICPNCLQAVNQEIQKVASRPKEKSSVIPGTVGALLGSLVGVLVWFIIYRLGYISAWSGLVMAVGAMWGYEKLGRALDLKGILISTVIVLAMVYVTNRLCWAYEFMDGINKYGGDVTFGDCFKQLEDLIKEFDLRSEYIRDLVIGYFLTVIGMLSMIVSSIRNRK